MHPDDRHLLGFEWQDQYDVDGMLPFGPRLAPKIFTAVADTLEWIVRSRGVKQLLRFCGPRDTPECAQALDTIITACEKTGGTPGHGQARGPDLVLNIPRH